MADPRSELRSWLVDVLKRHGGLHPCTFRLRHLLGGEGFNAVDEITVEKTDGATVEEVHSFLGTRSAQDALVLRGTQRYGVFLYVGDDARSKARFTWFVQAEDVDAGDEKDLGVTEKPDAKGVLAQQMRLNEVFARLLVTSNQATMQSLRDENRRLTDQNRWYAERDAARQIEHEEVLGKRQERELALEAHKATQGHIQDLVFTVRGLLPVCVNYLAGKSVLPVGTTADREALRVFMESLTPDQFMQLNGVLTPGQMMAVGTVWQSFAEEEKRRRAAQPTTPAGSPPAQQPPTTNGAH